MFTFWVMAIHMPGETGEAVDCRHWQNNSRYEQEYQSQRYPDYRWREEKPLVPTMMFPWRIATTWGQAPTISHPPRAVPWASAVP